ncbi:MAG: hypothetical protein UE295_07755 [Acutalibacteraceae bacterium]|nr:hypothetical protein [Acutalibacteraceae bacterium]
MSSTNKTSYLGLNAWLGSDRPQRIDFVDDNNKIDTAMKNHVNNNNMHCTSTEKAKIQNPYKMFSYVGTGTETNSFTIEFQPKFMIVFKKDTPPVQTDTSGNILINYVVTAVSNGSIGGAYISGYDITVNQSSEPVNGMIYNLNKKNGQYCIIAFK